MYSLVQAIGIVIVEPLNVLFLANLRLSPLGGLELRMEVSSWYFEMCPLCGGHFYVFGSVLYQGLNHQTSISHSITLYLAGVNHILVI